MHIADNLFPTIKLFLSIGDTTNLNIKKHSLQTQIITQRKWLKKKTETQRAFLKKLFLLSYQNQIVLIIFASSNL